MLKSIITSFLVLVSSALRAYAQEDGGSISMPYGRSLQLSMAAGCNFSLAGDVDQWWFGDRQAGALSWTGWYRICFQAIGECTLICGLSSFV